MTSKNAATGGVRMVSSRNVQARLRRAGDATRRAVADQAVLRSEDAVRFGGSLQRSEGRAGVLLRPPRAIEGP